ncbi:unnamed protein product [Notodromas monacha]|uniref:HTH OST-type domain-containing protein n=1 Tax=Notodromas monacha TaxID=399045 RepID=A0A7R9BTR7_9CRUS|nr:unnamed protein product [Notodromas monacha]CAG0919979.1 unnamed protein product [Notodromas monacha]
MSFEDYAELGQSFLAVAGAHDSPLTADAIRKEYRKLTGKDINPSLLGSHGRFRSLDDLLMSYSECFTWERVRNQFCYTPKVDRLPEAGREVRKMILKDSAVKDSKISGSTKDVYANYKNATQSRKDAFLPVENEIVRYLSKRPDGSVPLDVFIKEMCVKVLESAPYYDNIFQLLSMLPRFVMKNDQLTFRGNEKAIPNREEKADPQNLYFPEEKPSWLQENDVEKQLAELRTKWKLGARKMGVCGPGMFPNFAKSRQNVKVISGNSPTHFKVEVLDWIPPFTSEEIVQVKFLPDPLMELKMSVLAKYEGRWQRAEIVGFPVQYKRLKIEVYLIDEGIEVVVSPEEVAGLPVSFVKTCPRVAFLRWKSALDVNSAQDLDRFKISPSQCYLATFYSMFPDRSWLVDLEALHLASRS